MLANEADLKRQSLKFIALTSDSDKALRILKKQAEKEPSRKLVSLRKQIEDSEEDLLLLSKQLTVINSGIEEGGQTLGRLDNEIIEADAIAKEIFGRIKFNRNELKQAERDASFQVAIVTDLQNDIKLLQDQYKALEASKILLVQEKLALSKSIKEKTAILATITNEIVEKESRLKTLKSATSVASRNLNKIGDNDKTIREGLANKKLKLQEEEDRLKSQKAELKKEEIMRKQIDPQAKTPKVDNSKGYLKI